MSRVTISTSEIKNICLPVCVLIVSFTFFLVDLLPPGYFCTSRITPARLPYKRCTAVPHGESSNFRGSRMCPEEGGGGFRGSRHEKELSRRSHGHRDPAWWQTRLEVVMKSRSSYAKIANTRGTHATTGQEVVGASNRWSRNQVSHWWNY